MMDTLMPFPEGGVGVEMADEEVGEPEGERASERERPDDGENGRDAPEEYPEREQDEHDHDHAGGDEVGLECCLLLSQGRHLRVVADAQRRIVAFRRERLHLLLHGVENALVFGQAGG